ncbi:MAG: IS1595 family transposase [Rikenellaceae bacterium]|nr:IS1595 family transposase [Rikenellaceae bacterium]
MQIKSFIELISVLKDKRACREFLEEQRWHGKPICPHCGVESEEHYKLKSRGEFNGLYKCKECRKRFTVTVGTMFEGSNVSLEKWFYAIYIFLSHKKGISSVQLAKDINVTQKTAWFMLHRIRHNMRNKINVNFDYETQIDETLVGGKNKKRFKDTQGRSKKIKKSVVGLLSKGQVLAMVVPDNSADILGPIIRKLVRRGSTIITDGWKGYNGLHREYEHQRVIHKENEYVNADGYHTNSIEGFWSHLKRGIFGIYHLVSPKHLDKYCDEFAFRYNTRNIPDLTRFMMFIISTFKRLRYAELISDYGYYYLIKQWMEYEEE